MAVLGAAFFGCLYSAGYGGGFSSSAYEPTAFAGRKALFLVPHEDDDLMMAGATIRLYVQGGAEVTVVFATNGDDGSDAATRFAEGVRALKCLGVKEDNILFLGYGDKWVRDTYEHIYHAPGDETVASMAGHTETYGALGHRDFHTSVFGEPASYTRNNYKADIKNVLRTVRPDTVFCIDLDTHPDHCAVSWLFEEAMGELLKADRDYRPEVYKGYAYSTGWFAPADYYGDNLESTVLPPDRTILNDTRFPLDTPNYAWAERVRFPAPADALGYTERASSLYAAFAKHVSQGVRYRANNAINGDQVFWRRRTDSLTYLDGTKMTATSGETAGLNDFKLVDTDNVYDWPIAFDRGVWHPAAEDPVRQLTVTFPARTDVASVSLYDYYQPDSNITAGTLLFSDGSVEKVGPLQPDGQETRVTFPVKTGVTAFTFTVDAWEGEAPGLSELCAYGPEEAVLPDFIKLARAEGNQTFLYRYTVEKGTKTPLTVYAHPATTEPILLTVTEGDGSVTVENGVLCVAADAKPGNHTVRAELMNHPEIFDEIQVRVPAFWEKPWHGLLTGAEGLLDRLEYRIHALLYPA